MTKQQANNNTDWFRDAVPYVKAHHGKTFVILLHSLDQANAKQTLHDIAHLHTLGIKIVLVHGAREQINHCLKQPQGLIENNNYRVTDEASLRCVKQANAMIKMEIEAIMSETSSHKIISGNFITAQPVGILDGVDFKYTGKVRKIDTENIQAQLVQNMVLLSPLGYASTGQIFNLNAEEVASTVAISLQADKLILLHSAGELKTTNGTPITELTTTQAKALAPNTHLQRHLDSAIHACEHHIERVHILDTHEDSTLLKELFSSQGFGTMVTIETYETLRPAQPQDAASILTLITPLIAQGVLVPRSLETIHADIKQYSVLERDDKIIGTIALMPYPENAIGEIACVAIDQNYRKNNRGATLLAYAENIARTQKLKQLFVLSTQTSHWFIEQGYQPTTIDKLPLDKQKVYNLARNAKPYLKRLTP